MPFNANFTKNLKEIFGDFNEDDDPSNYSDIIFNSRS